MNRANVADSSGWLEWFTDSSDRLWKLTVAMACSPFLLLLIAAGTFLILSWAEPWLEIRTYLDLRGIVANVAAISFVSLVLSIPICLSILFLRIVTGRTRSRLAFATLIVSAAFVAAVVAILTMGGSHLAPLIYAAPGSPIYSDESAFSIRDPRTNGTAPPAEAARYIVGRRAKRGQPGNPSWRTWREKSGFPLRQPTVPLLRLSLDRS